MNKSQKHTDKASRITEHKSKDKRTTVAVKNDAKPRS